MRLPHRLQGQKVKSQGGAGAYCGGDLAAQLVLSIMSHVSGCDLAIIGVPMREELVTVCMGMRGNARVRRVLRAMS